MERRVDRHHIADTNQGLHVRVVLHAELLLDFERQAMPVRVMEDHVERLQAPEHRRSDPPGGHGADVHALEVVLARHAVGDVPATLDNPAV